MKYTFISLGTSEVTVRKLTQTSYDSINLTLNDPPHYGHSDMFSSSDSNQCGDPKKLYRARKREDKMYQHFELMLSEKKMSAALPHVTLDSYRERQNSKMIIQNNASLISLSDVVWVSIKRSLCTKSEIFGDIHVTLLIY